MLLGPLVETQIWRFLTAIEQLKTTQPNYVLKFRENLPTFLYARLFPMPVAAATLVAREREFSNRDGLSALALVPPGENTLYY
jgi:hypothetical protein